MSDTVIKVENLSKRYLLGTGGKSEGLRHLFHETATGPLRWLKRLSRRQPVSKANGTAVSHRQPAREFWALKNVSFDIKQGDVVGIIGRNGAGKSTLLKILSRITEPTAGRVEITGRIASLLEVGTGFHPELTGRENVFLNGAILGMRRAEITRKFDEIVAFAEVEKFLDTPVKRYSSGMYVRLAFAVAAHLDPEILIVDEVLAVGDAQFQNKCLGKMQDVANKGGRTVLFVSHNLTTVRQLCRHGLLLENGGVAMSGTANEVADRYQQTMLHTRRDQFRANDTGYTEMRLVNSQGAPMMSVMPEQDAFVELGIRITRGSQVQAGFTIFNQLDVPLVLCASEHGGVELGRGEHKFRVRIPNELLQPGNYRIEGAVWEAHEVFHKDDYLCHFQIIPSRSQELHGRGSLAQFVSREAWIPVPAVVPPFPVRASRVDFSNQ